MGQQGVELRRAASAREVSLADFRKDIIIDVFNEAGQKVLAYKVYRCWVSEYQALPDLDANANAVAIQTHQAGERGLGPRSGRDRAARAEPSPTPHECGGPGALPGGCWLDGSCHREAVMHPLTGADEAFLRLLRDGRDRSAAGAPPPCWLAAVQAGPVRRRPGTWPGHSPSVTGRRCCFSSGA